MKNSIFILLMSAWAGFACTGNPEKENTQHEAAEQKPKAGFDSLKADKVKGGFIFTEGPAADKEGNVYFTDQPNNRIHIWKTSGEVVLFTDSAGRSNGLYFHPNGNLYACADMDNELWMFRKDGSHEVVLENYEGRSFNGPNDLWINSRGDIYFTDPYYKRDYWEGEHPEMETKAVYLLKSGSEKAVRVAEGFKTPNGIVANEKENILYVSDMALDSTFSFSIKADGSLGERTYFTDLHSDGMTLDEEGNVYLTGKGVTIFNKAGEKIGHIDIDEDWTGNVCFGGKEHRTLFITASKGIYTVDMAVAGVR